MNDTPYEIGIKFEEEVANIYRLLGSDIERDVALAGNQIDIVIREKTPSGSQITNVVECKGYSRPIGVDVINSFAAIYVLLKQRGLTDKGTIVSAKGFTTRAREAAKEYGIDLLEIADLKARHKGNKSEVEQSLKKPPIYLMTKKDKKIPKPKRAFVLMPLSKEFTDVYILGISDVAEKLGLIVERADDIEHNSGILNIIIDRIGTSDVVIADTTGQNPNVFYEIGLSHASEKETILISRTGESIPFDLRNINHIFYENIVDLKKKLEKRLKAILKL